MRILILSLYYKPDLCAGSFRCTALVEQLKQLAGSNCEIEVITAMPNRYASFTAPALELEQYQGLTIKRIILPPHLGSMLKQIKGFIYFAKEVNKLTKKDDYALVFATSSRLMTAVLGAWIARKKKATLYLDIRDIFVATINDVFSAKVAFFIEPIFSLIEKWSFNRAVKINIVSHGFQSYFNERYPNIQLSSFTNGVDAEFISLEGKNGFISKKDSGPLTVLYAGNIGEGQGLHRIIPALAKQFQDSMKFRVIGDGSKQRCLIDAVRDAGCSNVELLPPVNREALLQEYQNADILFLHLNDYGVFRQVLPSKLFEYAATGKPIWAGVSGYSAEFIKKEIENAVVFEPCNLVQAKEIFRTLNLKNVGRGKFIEKYGRHSIMQKMAAEMLSLI